MSTLILIAFLGLVGGCFLIFSIDPMEFAKDLASLVMGREKTLKAKIKRANSNKELRGLHRIIEETKEILAVTGKESMFYTLWVFALFFFIIGTLFALLINNYIMIPVLSVGLSLLPFWYVIFSANFYKKQLNNELETSLSIITTAYLRSENFISAVKENIPYLNPPVSDVFRSFLTETSLISADINLALEKLKYKIASDVYREWVDAIIACQHDKTLKSTLTPIISKLSDMRVVSSELDILLYEPMKEFITMAILLIGNIPLIYFLNRSWYDSLMNTMPGKVTLAITALVVFVALAAVIRLTRPIEYKR